MSPATFTRPAPTTKGARTRQRIMAAGAELFASGGYDATPVQAIAEHAGITVAAIYRHFPSKSELLIAVAREALTVTGLESPTKGDVADRLAALVVGYAHSDRYLSRRLAIELSQAATRHPDVARALQEFHARVRDGLAQELRAGQATGEVAAAVDPTSLARTILIMVMGMTHIDTLDPALATNRRWLATVAAEVRQLVRG